ncbi:hypothetical protein BKE30_14765 [Alkanindiges hydrocarboniclasticus]|jgi:DNA-binding protein H-NS|uniref:DNA-binding protein H-NS-like C-terminal domain-containing protein n=1 Tax=Alkanindiges hydrocarboniclasticus TaxID=1907941 RepID=A0A1S8CQI9_9GAMM|nr:H-NS histone family protein [Alkanindiges hydrocarboniclasticus]ONG37388.1 hypothetical protein BKE30_14765 [Alkanindiges hydrocarboniclasticus]
MSRSDLSPIKLGDTESIDQALQTCSPDALASIMEAAKNRLDQLKSEEKAADVKKLIDIVQKHRLTNQEINNILSKSGSIFTPSGEALRSSNKNMYVNPNNPSQTWFGLGRLPQWIKDYEAVAGQSRSDLIQKN